MIISTKVVGPNTEVTITFSAPTTKMLTALAAISEAVYKHTRGPNHPRWDTLTNQEKLDIIGKYVQTTLVSLAYKFMQKKAAGDAAKAVDKADYEL